MSPSMLLLLGKVWPVGGPLLVSSQRGKGPFGVGCNGVTTTREVTNFVVVLPVAALDLARSQEKGQELRAGFGSFSLPLYCLYTSW